jgi:L-arabinonolactonase
MAAVPGFSCVLDAHADTGETPVWSSAEQALYWVDLGEPSINRFDPATGKNQKWKAPSTSPSFALRGPGKPILVALHTGIYDLDTATGAFTQRLPAPYDLEKVRFNDGRTDPAGRYWIGSYDFSFLKTFKPGGARFYRLDDRGMVEMIQGVTVSNGLAFSPDGHTMYTAESAEGVAYAYDYDVKTGTPSNRREFIKFKEGDGHPDGATTDAQGGYWVALIGGAVARYTPEGKLDRRIEVPVMQPTSVAFGGADMKTLYMVSASHRHMQGDAPLGEQAGGVFAMKTDVAGFENALYRY